jgi:hypothetical protein
VKGISKKLHTPNQLNDIKYFPHSTTNEILNIFRGREARCETTMLPDHQYNKSYHADDKDKKVDECLGMLMKESC